MMWKCTFVLLMTIIFVTLRNTCLCFAEAENCFINEDQDSWTNKTSRKHIL